MLKRKEMRNKKQEIRNQKVRITYSFHISYSLFLVSYYLMLFINLFHLGPLSQLNQMRDAFPTICVSGTKPQ